MRNRPQLLLGLSLLLAGACARAPSGGQSETRPAAPPPADPLPRAALVSALPAPAGHFGPSEMALTGGALRGAALADRGECEGCHADVAASYRASAHAFASFNNPAYRAAVDRFRDDAGEIPSRFCGGCHDVSLMVDGAMDRAVEAADPRAHAGIGCRTCHGVVETRIDGNGSFTLTAEPVPIPRQGDPASAKAHAARVAPQPLRTTALCGSCHRAFLGEGTGNAHHLIGQDDFTPWQQSAYAGSRAHLLDEEVPAKDCRGCHMPREAAPEGDPGAKNGTIASHRFLGGHTWLAAMRKDEETLAQTRALLEGAASIDIAAMLHPDGKRSLPADNAPVAPGERAVIEVVLRNQHVGHRFPGGTLDAADAWIEIEVRDATGALVAEAGREHEKTGDDPSAHRLRSMVVGDDGKPLVQRETNRFRGTAFNHTLLPREAEVVGYSFEAPAAQSAFPLRVVARLRHRSRSLPVQEAACASTRNARGKSFAAAGADLDACTPQPVTTIAEAEAWIGEGSQARKPERAPRPTWKRLYEHGLGMIRALQEKRDEARPSLEAALGMLEGSPDPRPRAMVLGALGMLAGRQGRVEEALAWLDKAAPLAPDHPAIPYLRGDALATVWRWEKAAPPLAEAAEKTPGDDSVWALLAIARGSANDPPGALVAAQRGLVIQPRDHDLLRIQALSLEALGAPEAEVRGAWEAWNRFRPADVIPRVKAKCSATVPGCALERDTAHVHAMRAAAGKR